MARHLILATFPARPLLPRVLDAAANGWPCEAWPRLPVEPPLHLRADDAAWDVLRSMQQGLEQECGCRLFAAWKGDFGGMVTHELEIARQSAGLVAALTALGATEEAAEAWVPTLRRVVTGHWRHVLDEEALV